jgi:putative beta-lysine N-acetyltransferase
MIRKQADVLEYIEGSLVQHGPYNDRIYLMKLGTSKPEKVAPALLKKAVESGYSKIFAKVPDCTEGIFLRHGFRVEARIPNFYNGRGGAIFLGFYLAEQRAREGHRAAYDDLIDLCLKGSKTGATHLPDGFSVRRCTKEDVGRMAEIYSTVFPTYPFPIYDAHYLIHMLKTHVQYFGVEVLDNLVALSSAEMDEEAENSEMTDFATLPAWGGYRLATHLLKAMEEAMCIRKTKMAYTIARSASAGMNHTFAASGYSYAGRLVNNTNISGQIESMNVWYKPLS